MRYVSPWRWEQAEETEAEALVFPCVIRARRLRHRAAKMWVRVRRVCYTCLASLKPCYTHVIITPNMLYNQRPTPKAFCNYFVRHRAEQWVGAWRVCYTLTSLKPCYTHVIITPNMICKQRAMPNACCNYFVRCETPVCCSCLAS